MRGLLLNNFYSMSSNIKLSFSIALVLVFVSLFVGGSFLPMIMGIQLFIFILNTGASLQIDEISKWSKFELTLPVKRRTIINAKYVSFIILIAIGILISTLTAIVYIVFKGSVDIKTLIWSYCFGLTLSIATPAFMYPFILKFGTEKSDLIILLSSGLSVVLMFSISILLSLFVPSINFRSPIVGITSLIVSVLLFILSYFLAVWIHRNKEYS